MAVMLRHVCGPQLSNCPPHSTTFCQRQATYSAGALGPGACCDIPDGPAFFTLTQQHYVFRRPGCPQLFYSTCHAVMELSLDPAA